MEEAPVTRSSSEVIRVEVNMANQAAANLEAAHLTTQEAATFEVVARFLVGGVMVLDSAEGPAVAADGRASETLRSSNASFSVHAV